jgi:periplasmic divalent cation tolerance protein
MDRPAKRRRSGAGGRIGDLTAGLKTAGMSSDTVILLSNFPDADPARKAVRTLVEERLAACGNIIPGVESIYEWKGALETAAEVTVLIKTTASLVVEAQRRLRSLHPYEVPEILQIPVTGGWPDYLAWVAGQCRPEK